MFALLIAFGINFGWGNHPTFSNYHYWNNYHNIYCEEVNEQGCVHRDEYDFIYFCNGAICDDHDLTSIPEDCTINSIENNECRFGVLSDN